MQEKTILILFGGYSPEYDVSLQSAYAVLTHIDRTRYNVLSVGINRDGAWLLYTGAPDGILSDDWNKDTAHCIPCALRPDRGHAALLPLDGSGRELYFDAAFPVLHGKNGEDGTIQGLFELAGVPLIGCGTLASALCMDKDRAHRLVAAAGVRVPRSIIFEGDARPVEIVRAADQLGYPLFVKPVRGGSSLGISRVETADSLMAAVGLALQYDRQVLLEESVAGFEVGCAVLGNRALTVGLVDEITLADGFFDYEEKYTLKTAQIRCPARVSMQKAREIRQTARTIYRALDCRGFARVDMFVTPDGDLVFNEVNTIPGLTAHSRYPGMMKGIGLDLSELIERFIELGVRQ